ncbi:MAG: DUF559 domain-containing protein [Propionibacteriaceae bacterium]|nr:DUF559 domain-containing protein [Propionibacteriaceae bacterium]
MDFTQSATTQFGVLSRTQALEAMTPDAVRWKLTRGLWRRVHPGVYAVHTQPLDWHARASAALLFYGPESALSQESAAYVIGIDDRPPPLVHVDVPASLRRHRQTGVRLRRRRRLLTVPRDRLRVTEPACTVIDLGDHPTSTRDDAISVVARAVQRHKVTVEALEQELGARRAHRHRRALELALGIVADGAESGLEVDFVTRVLRPHGLPEMRMAVPDSAGGRSIRRDFVDDAHKVVVELDSRVAHEGRRVQDSRRDRLAAARGFITLRAEWADVHYAACQLAAELFATQQSRGCRGVLRPCGPRCTVSELLRRSA